MKTPLVLLLVLIVASVLFYSCTHKISRSLLTENQVYHWKVYHVKENNFNVGTTHYFEVYLGNKKLVLPQALTGGSRKVSCFIAAGSLNSGETNYDSVMVIFEGFVKNEQGYEKRQQMSVRIKSLGTKDNKVAVYNLCNGKSAILEIE